MINAPTGSKLDIETENAVVRRAQAGDLAARNALIEHHLPFMRTVIARTIGPAGDIDAYLGCATAAFIRAIAKFDTTRGIRLVTYAYRAIKSGLIDERTRGRVISLPKYQYQRRPTYIRAVERANGARSLDFETGDGLRPFVAVAPRENDAAERAEYARWLMEHLDERSRTVLDLRQRGLTLTQVAEHLGVTRARVHQIEKNVLEQLRTLAAA